LRVALGVEAVAWIPTARVEAIVVAGALNGFDPEAFRALTAQSRVGVWLSSQPAAGGSPVAGSQAGCRVAVASASNGSENPIGWLVAVNPRRPSDFQASELELLPSVAGIIATQRSNARLYSELKDLLFGVVRALTSAIDAKDPYTSGHSERVARIAVRLGEELELSISQRGDLYLLGLLHDVGKIGIRDDLLKKPGALTKEEYAQIQAHVLIGIQILSSLRKLKHLVPGVKHHHECMDGSGYPSGLVGEQIPMEARVLAVADAFDAMSSSRPYRDRLSPAEIDERFHRGAGKQWDAGVVRALFACRADLDRIRQKGLGESLRAAVGGAMVRP
jgi:HD-GYP domain-containing protein (c-di-GMP phosphodiesterase class II)